MKENMDNATCEPCEERFEQTIDYLVKEGEGPSESERDAKEQEVEAAFAEKEPASEK